MLLLIWDSCRMELRLRLMRRIEWIMMMLVMLRVIVIVMMMGIGLHCHLAVMSVDMRQLMLRLRLIIGLSNWDHTGNHLMMMMRMRWWPHDLMTVSLRRLLWMLGMSVAVSMAVGWKVFWQDLSQGRQNGSLQAHWLCRRVHRIGSCSCSCSSG